MRPMMQWKIHRRETENQPNRTEIQKETIKQFLEKNKNNFAIHTRHETTKAEGASKSQTDAMA